MILTDEIERLLLNDPYHRQVTWISDSFANGLARTTPRSTRFMLIYSIDSDRPLMHYLETLVTAEQQRGAAPTGLPLPATALS